MKYVMRAVWALGIAFYASTYYQRMKYGDPALRAEDAFALLIAAGVGALVWWPWPARTEGDV